MKVTRANTSVTRSYTVEDGPLVGTNPQRLSQGTFRVEYMAVSWHNGQLHRVFVRGQRVNKDGTTSRTKHDRTFLASEVLDWMEPYLDVSV